MSYARKGRRSAAHNKKQATRRERYLKNARLERERPVVESRFVSAVFQERGWA